VEVSDQTGNLLFHPPAETVVAVLGHEPAMLHDPGDPSGLIVLEIQGAFGHDPAAIVVQDVGRAGTVLPGQPVPIVLIACLE